MQKNRCRKNYPVHRLLYSTSRKKICEPAIAEPAVNKPVVADDPIVTEPTVTKYANEGMESWFLSFNLAVLWLMESSLTS